MMRLPAVVLVSATLAACVARSTAATPTTRPIEVHVALATRAITSLRLSDADVTDRLTAATTRYLVTIDAIRVELSAELKALTDAARPGSPDADAVARANRIARATFVALRDGYVRALGESLRPLQVDRVRDGLTDDALPRFAAMYDEMIPAMTPGERSHVLALLVEMRENAITHVDPVGQKHWQDRYRGIINNYLARQGHDFASLALAWDARNPEQPATRPSR